MRDPLWQPKAGDVISYSDGPARGRLVVRAVDGGVVRFSLSFGSGDVRVDSVPLAEWTNWSEFRAVRVDRREP